MRKIFLTLLLILPGCGHGRIFFYKTFEKPELVAIDRDLRRLYVITSPMVCASQDLVIDTRSFSTAGQGSHLTEHSGGVLSNDSELQCSKPGSNADICLMRAYRDAHDVTVVANRRIVENLEELEKVKEEALNTLRKVVRKDRKISGEGEKRRFFKKEKCQIGVDPSCVNYANDVEVEDPDWKTAREGFEKNYSKIVEDMKADSEQTTRRLMELREETDRCR